MSLVKKLPIVRSPDEGEALQPQTDYHFRFSFRACDPSPDAIRLGLPPVIDDHDDDDDDHTHSLTGTYRAPSLTTFTSLPSSAYMKTAYPPTPGRVHENCVFEVLIRYQVRVLLLRPCKHGASIISQSESAVTILDDSLGVQPPTCVSDFRSEYKLCHEATAYMNKRWLWKNRLMRLRTKELSLLVHASEPPPLLLRNSDTYATTPLSVKLTIPTTNCDQTSAEMPSTLPKVEVCISWHLQKSMFSSLEGLDSVPIITSNISACEEHRVVSQTAGGLVHKYTHCLNNHDWQKDMDDDMYLKCLPWPSGVDAPAVHNVNKAEDVYLSTGSRTRTGNNHAHSEAFAEMAPAEQGEHSSMTELTRSLSDTVLPGTNISSAEDTSKSDIPSPRAAYSVTITVPIYIPTELLPTPTSFTPFITTRYSLKLDIKATLISTQESQREEQKTRNMYARPHSRFYEPTSTIKMASHKFRASLNVPVQIVYNRPSTTQDVDAMVACPRYQPRPTSTHV